MAKLLLRHVYKIYAGVGKPKKNAKGAIDLLKNSGEYNLARMKELIFKG